MERFDIRKVDESFYIEGFPDAVKVVRLCDAKAKRLADLALHRADLDFAIKCLEGINLIASDLLVLQEGLWRSAIVHFMKCFGDNDSRFSINAKQVYKNDSDALAVFEYFKALRNKHLVHDANSYAQSLPGAIINKETDSNKIAKIVCTTILGATLVQDNYNNLHRLLTYSQAWVVEQFDTLCDLLMSELENLPYEDLISRDSVHYQAPNLDELFHERSPPI